MNPNFDYKRDPYNLNFQQQPDPPGYMSCKQKDFTIKKGGKEKRKENLAIIKSIQGFGACAIVFDSKHHHELILHQLAQNRSGLLNQKLNYHDTVFEFGSFLKGVLKHQKKMIRDKIKFQNKVSDAPIGFSSNERMSSIDYDANNIDHSISNISKQKDENAFSDPTSSNYTANRPGDLMMLDQKEGEP